MLDRFERFSLSISKISRYWNKIAAEEMEKYQLKGPCALYLLALKRHAEGMTAARLSEYCERDKADVSRAIALMEANGLVQKETVGTHHYRARIVLTEKGCHAAECIAARAMKAVEYGGKGVDDDSREIFYQTLEQIASNLRLISEAGLPEE